PLRPDPVGRGGVRRVTPPVFPPRSSYPMEQATARQSAIAAVTAWQPHGQRITFKETPVRQIFGINVFSDDVMRSRLPENIYKAIRATIKKGAPLEPIVADVVATVMKEWAIEKGATHYTHWFQPMTGLTAE